ncbi:MAG: hypothetical protein FWH52_03825 [Synergistaceae bacterium]|nr:hypothetical protein [Synergistaceae bacterium]
MKNRFFRTIIFAFLAVLLSCGVCFADLLTLLPKIETEETGSYSRIAVRFTDAGKLLEDLYPSRLFEALAPMSSYFELDPLIKISNIVKALSKSNLRGFALLIVMDDVNSEIYDGGMIISLQDGNKTLEEAVKSGKLSLFDLVLSLGEPVLEAMKAIDDSFADFEFERDSDGIFFYEDNYVYIEGDKIITFDTKESVLSVVDAIKSGAETSLAGLEYPNIAFLNISRKIADTSEDLKIEIGLSYENSIWNIKTRGNVIKLMSKIRNLEQKALEKDQEALLPIPMTGKGIPFFMIGGDTFLDDTDDIEEWLMKTGDMDLTLDWAMFLYIAKQFGISKVDIGNMFSGSTAIILGLDTKFFGITMPFGGYVALTGKNGAAAQFQSAISKALEETATVTEPKVDEWDKVLAVRLVPGAPNVLIAQKDETLLIGVMNPEDIESEINTKDVGMPNERMLSWLILNTERIWKSIRNVYSPLSGIILSGLFFEVSDSEKEAIQFARNLINTDFPVNALNIWVPSIDELEINISMNPSPEGDFWGVFFEWLAKMFISPDSLRPPE